MQENHIPQIANIEKLCFSSPWTETGLKEELSNPSAVFFCAEENGVVTGYMGFHFVLDEGYVANVAVHPNYRNKGVGKALVAHAHEIATQKGLSFLSLEVRQSNTPAKNLYTKMGYTTVGKRPNFYTNPNEDALIMTKTF
jgi:ribosomal-protein-alanine N-acetyltransferase